MLDKPLYRGNKNLKPDALATSLSMIELKHLGFTSEGVDHFYAQKAKQDKQRLAAGSKNPKKQVEILSDIG